MVVVTVGLIEDACSGFFGVFCVDVVVVVLLFFSSLFKTFDVVVARVGFIEDVCTGFSDDSIIVVTFVKDSSIEGVCVGIFIVVGGGSGLYLCTSIKGTSLLKLNTFLK